MSTLLDVLQDNPGTQRKQVLMQIEEKLGDIGEGGNPCVLSIINNVYNPQARPYGILEITTIGIVEQMLSNSRIRAATRSTLF